MCHDHTMPPWPRSPAGYTGDAAGFFAANGFHNGVGVAELISSTGPKPALDREAPERNLWR
jgi:hypothetical protein